MTNCFAALQIIAEQRIEEAVAKGEFDNLPGAGKPLILEDFSQIPPELRMAYKILKNAGCVPEEISQRKEISQLTELLDKCPDEKERLASMARLKYLLGRLSLGSRRHAALEANDEYYQKALAKLERVSTKN